MNEDHKKRGLTHSKLLTAVAISSLLLSSGNVMAAQTASTWMTVTELLTLCPEKILSGFLFSSALFPFTRPSSVPVTSGQLLLISATSTLFHVFNTNIIN